MRNFYGVFYYFVRSYDYIKSKLFIVANIKFILAQNTYRAGKFVQL